MDCFQIAEAMTTDIIFTVNNGKKEILRLCANGDILLRGKLLENDKDLVDGLREFLNGNRR